jgi:hypothetical protein
MGLIVHLFASCGDLLCGRQRVPGRGACPAAAARSTVGVRRNVQEYKTFPSNANGKWQASKLPKSRLFLPGMPALDNFLTPSAAFVSFSHFLPDPIFPSLPSHAL